MNLASWVKKKCLFAAEKVQYLFVDEFTDQEITNQAWALVKSSGINVLSQQDLYAVAAIGDKVVGALFTSSVGPKYSFDVIVHPDYQKRGIGFELAKIGNDIQHEEGFEEQFPEGLEHNIASPGGAKLVEKLNKLQFFIRSICKFAQQQKLLDFDEPDTFSEKPEEHPELKKVLMDYTPTGAEEEEFVDGFYHVTTNLPAVLQWGALKSRKQLGGEVPGLGGGAKNEAPNKISLTHSLNKAYTIFEGLLHAARICSNEVTASEIFNSTLSDYGFPDDFLMESDVQSFLENWMTSEQMGEDGENIDTILDQKIKTPKQKYDFLTQLEAVLNTQMERYDMEFAGPPVGLTVPFEVFCQLNPKNIAILKLQVRKGAPYEHVPQELELRFDPDDVRLPDGAVIKRA